MTFFEDPLHEFFLIVDIIDNKRPVAANLIDIAPQDPGTDTVEGSHNRELAGGQIYSSVGVGVPCCGHVWGRGLF